MSALTLYPSMGFHGIASIDAGLTVIQKWVICYKLVGERQGSHPSAFRRETSWGETRWDGEKWPFIFDGDEREGELTVIQTAFCADPQLRISHAGSKCGVLGGQWPLPTGPPEKRPSKNETLKWCLTASESQVLSTCKNAISSFSNNWKCLHWCWYHYDTSCWSKGTFWFQHIHTKSLCWSLFTYGLSCATKSNRSTL